MNGLEIMFDGINIQHVGELLLDEPASTRRVRRLCFDSYYRTLKDFAFAVIFGGKIVTSVAMPSGRRNAGRELVRPKVFRGEAYAQGTPVSGVIPELGKPS